MELGGGTTPARAALAVLSDDLHRLVGVLQGGLGADGPDGFVAFLQEFEAFRNRLPVVDHLLLQAAAERDLAAELGQPKLAAVLTQALRISPAEAGRRVRAAEQLGDRAGMLGEALPPRRPVLAAAQADGAVTPEQVTIILTGLALVDRPGYDPDDVARGEATLTGLAATFGTKDLHRCTERFVAHLDPDGTRPRDELNHDRRHLDLRPQADGSWRGELRLTGPAGAKLNALLSPLAKPRVNTITGADGKPIETLDTRTYGQRMHDALEDVCDRLLRAGTVPDTGGTPTTVIVTLPLEDLLTRTGHGTTTDGRTHSTRELLAMASEAEIIPAVLNSTGAVLDLGRTRRIASRNQTLALIARDAGCSFPGCAHPPQWCERHHIREWSDGGLTDLNNLTLLCRYHHHNFASRGWACRINRDGLPEWIPPRHVDRTQTPLINTRIQAALCPRPDPPTRPRAAAYVTAS